MHSVFLHVIPTLPRREPHVAALAAVANLLEEGQAVVGEEALHVKDLPKGRKRAFGVGRAIVVGPSAAKRGLGFAIDQFEKVLRKKGAGDALPEIDKGNSSVGEACEGPAACVAAAGGRELFTVGPEPTLPSAQPLSERLRRRVGMFGGLGAG